MRSKIKKLFLSKNFDGDKNQKIFQIFPKIDLITLDNNIFFLLKKNHIHLLYLTKYKAKLFKQTPFKFNNKFNFFLIKPKCYPVSAVFATVS